MNRAGKCIQLSRDHRPTDPEEMKRIEESGGKVIGGRLQGELALSRAFGDYRFKIDSSLLTCDPEIREFSLTADVEYIVVACDGLYETFENNEVIEFINHQLSNYPSKTMNEIAKALTEEAIDRGSHDNITVIIIKFEKKYRKMLSTNTSRSCKKKQNEVLLNIKRKSLDTTLKPKEMRAEKKRRPGINTPPVNFDDVESISDEQNTPPSLIISVPDIPEQEIKNFGKKTGQMKNKAKKSKDYLPNFRIKKSNSKEDLSQENKKAKLQNSLRLRSKSTEDPSASNSRTFLEKKRIRKNDSSDECEKEQLKSSKKKKKKQC